MLKRRRLPHLDIIGQPQFITFRLHGSLPMHRSFPAASLTSGQAFVTMDRILDAARCGPTYLERADVADVMLASLDYVRRLGTTNCTRG